MNRKAQAVAAELPRLQRYAMALLGERHLAEDLIQDTVERALSRLHLWRRGSDMRAWLFTIMHNIHVNDAKYRRRAGHHVPIADLADHLSRSPEQPERLALIETANALRRLPDDQREVILLVALEGLSYREVAGVVGIPIGTVMSRLGRGREALRRAVDAGDAPPALRRVK